MAEETLEYQRKDHVLVIDLNSSLDHPLGISRMSADLCELCHEVALNEEVRVVVISDTGENAFLGEKGWTKKEIKTFLFTYARVPAYRHPSYWGASRGDVQKENVPINPMDPVPVFRNPEWIRILVAGGPGAFIGLFAGSFIGRTD